MMINIAKDQFSESAELPFYWICQLAGSTYLFENQSAAKNMKKHPLSEENIQNFSWNNTFELNQLAESRWICHEIGSNQHLEAYCDCIDYQN